MTPDSDSTYTIDDHRHNFAAWASARAVTRGFTTVAVLIGALESCGVAAFVRAQQFDGIQRADFDQMHARWCEAVLNKWAAREVPGRSYGRAAKLIAVYLKTMIVVGPHSATDLARVAHPPIDRILLQNAARTIGGEHSSAWRTTNWTQLDREAYCRLIDQLRATMREGEPFWRLEQYWHPTGE